MTMSTQILDEAARLLAANVLIDSVQIGLAGEAETVGFDVVRSFTPQGQPVKALVQTTVLANAAESRVDSVYSIKVPYGTDLQPGMAVEVLTCDREPGLVGRRLLVDKVSENGAALLRKAVASRFEVVNQEGKGDF